jgi:hypothetical protein
MSTDPVNNPATGKTTGRNTQEKLGQKGARSRDVVMTQKLVPMFG